MDGTEISYFVRIVKQLNFPTVLTSTVHKYWQNLFIVHAGLSVQHTREGDLSAIDAEMLEQYQDTCTLMLDEEYGLSEVLPVGLNKVNILRDKLGEDDVHKSKSKQSAVSSSLLSHCARCLFTLILR
jgi:hypothetical protein